VAKTKKAKRSKRATVSDNTAQPLAQEPAQDDRNAVKNVATDLGCSPATVYLWTKAAGMAGPHTDRRKLLELGAQRKKFARRARKLLDEMGVQAGNATTQAPTHEEPARDRATLASSRHFELLQAARQGHKWLFEQAHARVIRDFDFAHRQLLRILAILEGRE
jgi:hypothetical protein